MRDRAGIARNRIHRVVNRVQRLCDYQWTLAELASVAFLSKYHFLRVFESIVGETPGHFLQRIRLERAARMLVYHRDVSITNIAHTCGFGSSQSLARAFRSRFLTSPSNFRQTNFLSYDQLRHATGVKSSQLPRNVGDSISSESSRPTELPDRLHPSSRSVWCCRVERFWSAQSVDGGARPGP